MLDPGQNPDQDQEPEPECITVPVPLRQKVAIPAVPQHCFYPYTVITCVRTVIGFLQIAIKKEYFFTVDKKCLYLVTDYFSSMNHSL